MDPLNESLFAGQSLEAPAVLAGALAPPAAPGHFDELRGTVTLQGPPRPSAPALPAPLYEASSAPPLLPTVETGDPAPRERAALAPSWAGFFEHLGTGGFDDLPRRAVSLERQIRDNGVTYNVYADADGPQRPWSLDLFPLIVSPESWAQIEAGVAAAREGARPGDGRRLRAAATAGRRPAARRRWCRAIRGYLRSMHGVRPTGDTWLHIAAFDLARGPDGNWWVVSQRTQAPSGLGYLLENRLAISRQFPQAFEHLHVQRLAATYSAMMDGLQRLCPAGQPPHIALLTPGPLQRDLLRACLPGALPRHHAGRGQRPDGARPAALPEDPAGPAAGPRAGASGWTTSSSTRSSCAPIRRSACRACCRRSVPATCWWPTCRARPSSNRRRCWASCRRWRGG